MEKGQDMLITFINIDPCLCESSVRDDDRIKREGEWVNIANRKHCHGLERYSVNRHGDHVVGHLAARFSLVWVHMDGPEMQIHTLVLVRGHR